MLLKMKFRILAVTQHNWHFPLKNDDKSAMNLLFTYFGYSRGTWRNLSCHIWIACFLFISTITLCEPAFLVQISSLSSNTDLSHLSNLIRSYGLLRTRSQDHQTHCQHGDKGYSQLIDIVNFCGKQHNISSSKKHMALIYCQWSNDLGFISRSSDN